MNKQDFLNRFMLHHTASISFQNTLPAPMPDVTLKKAAILMPLIQRKNGLHMILTQRALHLKHHAGQVSFPGGKHEITDKNLAHTALRETEEEIGINQESIQLIGSLPSLTTITGYHITPFIGFVKAEQQILIDHQEVKECFEVPFSFLLNPQNFSKQRLFANKKRAYTYCCTYRNHLIWGATAQMLINLQLHINDVTALK